MTVEDAIQQGDFQQALAGLVQETGGPSADPGRLLMRFNMEARLQRFDDAEATMRRLVAAAPDIAGAVSAFGDAARAERMATHRMRDARLAGDRRTVGLPPPYVLALTKAAVCHASGDSNAARAALAEADATTPPISGTLTRVTGQTERFTSLRDSDALTGATLPVYDGPNLLDLAFTELRSVTFLDPKTSLDVMWLVADIELLDGRRLRARVPSFYVGTGLADEGSLRAGQSTAWQHDRGYAVAIGQRDLSIGRPDGGSSLTGLLGVRRIDFDGAPRAGASIGPGHGSPHTAAAATKVRSLEGSLVALLGARAALPVLGRLFGGFGLGYQGYELVKGALSLGALVLYFVWFARLLDWLKLARGGAKYSTGLAIGGWFIPFVNVAMPYLALDDAAERTLGRPAPAVLGWWICYVLMTLIATVFSLTSGGPIPFGSPIIWDAMSWLLTLSQIGAYGLWAHVVRELSRAVR